MATAGNFAGPLSPHEQDVGAVSKFSLYHVVDLDAGEEFSLFPIKTHQIGLKDSTAKALPTLSDEKVKQLQNASLADLVTKVAPEGPAQLHELARIIRSKNSVPFKLTLDVIFDKEADFERVKSEDVLTNDVIKKLSSSGSEEDILTDMYFQPALA